MSRVRAAHRGLAAVALTLAAAPPAAAHEWQRRAPLGLARTEVAAARIGDHAYVAGGFEQATGATTGAVERYDLRTGRTTRTAPLPVPLNHAAETARGS
jgi:hypothetical protein